MPLRAKVAAAKAAVLAARKRFATQGNDDDSRVAHVAAAVVDLGLVTCRLMALARGLAGA